MPAALLGPANRFAIRGNVQVLFIPKSVMPSGTLTLAAMTNASTTNLTAAIAAMAGFSREQGDLPAPDVATMETPTVPGEITRAASSITFYLSKDGNDVRSVLLPKDEGFIVIGESGLAVGQLVDKYPVEVKFGAKVREDVARVTVPFSIGVGVQENVAVPAA